MNISDNAAALAFIVAGVTAGSWAAVVTSKISTLTRAIRDVETLLEDVLGEAWVAQAKARRGTHGAHRDPRQLLGHR